MGTTVALGEVLRLSLDPQPVEPTGAYPMAGVYGFGRGMIERNVVHGHEIAADRLYRISSGQFIYSRLKSFEGAFALVPHLLNGRFVSNEFPTFDIDTNNLSPAYLSWYFRQEKVWRALAAENNGIGARRERLHPERFLQHFLPLPPIAEQRRIAERLDRIAAEISRRRTAADAADAELASMLRAAFDRVTTGAPRVRMGDVAPLVRRSVRVDLNSTYAEVGIRSFGKGTFHKPPLSGEEVGSKRLFRVLAGDLLFNIVFAWEGAVAVARPADDGRVGSHRFLTCVPDMRRATAEFLRYHFLTPGGLQQLGEASPGGAGRNRTLGLKPFERIPVPIPSLDAQKWFGALQQKAAEVRQAYAASDRDLNALLPAMLDRAFRAELVPQDPNDEPASVLLERIRAGRATEAKPNRRRGPSPRPSPRRRGEGVGRAPAER